ncbi:LysR family transcriptional regulator [Pseudomonas sp. NPDC089547]|uniref:LysR family transcriptional regulator n=1 Tax=Pseudomonas sp. NPDC089547 TaxID=3390652 RepID=UPI003D06677B
MPSLTYSHKLDLKAMSAFEASARLGGFSKAATELKVTPERVAALVRSLEIQYGAELFERHTSGEKLTQLGKCIKAEFIAAFDAIEQAAQSISNNFLLQSKEQDPT